ncbi:MAG TPA: carbon-nitrogen hydrolase family protein [Terriglobia bacterium]|nr:carbon-nitrogen hydrolase family protein [Terriglobia bacterium]
MKIAVVQMDVKILDKAGNLKNILEQLGAAAKTGAKIVIFPECALTGYCYESLDEARPMAEPIPGPSTESIARAARELDCTVVVGMLERSGDKIFNAAAVIGPDGVHGAYRKIHLPYLGIDRFVTPGDTPFPAFATRHGKIGVVICYDCSFPESGRLIKLKGAELLAIPTNWPSASDTFQHVPSVRAMENHIIVAAADRVGEERGFRFAGHSQIIDFSGATLKEAGETEEIILEAEVDLEAASRNRVIRAPSIWEFDRIADRRPEMYAPITQPAEFRKVAKG